MAPPSNVPRVQDLVPGETAEQALAAITAHLELFSPSVAPEVHIAFPPSADASELRERIEALVTYAQCGAGQRAAKTAWDSIALVTRLFEARGWDVYKGGAAPDPQAYDREGAWGPTKGGEPTTALGVVLLAAHTRAMLDQGKALTVSLPGVAALASLSLRQVQTLREGGEFGREIAGGVSSVQALKWLKGRNVAGF